MTDLIEYLNKNVIRCEPGAGDVDVVFFGVKKGDNVNAQELREAISNHKGIFTDIDPLDGNEHNYISLGGWLGDQGLALMLIGLGTTLGLWKLLSPKTILGESVPPKLEAELAGRGMISIRAKS